MRRVSTWLLLLSLTFGSGFSPAMAKEKARITDVTLVIDKGGVGISFSVQHCFSPKIEETIQSGVPVTVFFSVRLSQTKRLWRDRRLASLRFARRIHYDNLKKVYEVFLEDTSPAVVFEDFSEASESLASVDNVRLIPRRPLTEQATYYVSLKAELDPVRLPFRLESVLFFVSSGRRETDWFVQRFRVGSFVLPKKEETQ